MGITQRIIERIRGRNSRATERAESDDSFVASQNDQAPDQESGTWDQWDGIERYDRPAMRRWSAGATSINNARFFQRNSTGPSAINRDCVQRLDALINNCRSEISRSAYLQGVIDIDTTLLVGENGPRIDIVCDARGGDAWAARAETIVNEWTENCDISEGRSFVDFLAAIGRGLWTDGCGLFEEVTARRDDGPVSLRLSLIDPLYLATPPELLSSPSVVMGVEVDQNGAPTRYHIGDIEHRTRDYLAWLNSNPRPADLVHHVTDPLHMEASQLRGVPYAGSTLEASAQLRALDKAILDALETAAKMNIVLQTTDPKIVGKHHKMLNTAINLDRNAATAIPPGYEANGIASQHPHNNQIAFAEYLLSQIGRPVSLPVTYVLGSFRSANFSSGRMDGGMHSRSVTRRRGVIKRKFIDPVIKNVITEATRARALSRAPGPWRIVLTWPSSLIQPDPLKHYMAQQMAIANGTSSLSAAASENGYTLEAIVKQHERDRQLFIDAGLPLPWYMIPPEGEPSRTRGSMTRSQFDELLNRMLAESANEEKLNNV